jgi:hypothetical protein
MEKLERLIYRIVNSKMSTKFQMLKIQILNSQKIFMDQLVLAYIIQVLQKDQLTMEESWSEIIILRTIILSLAEDFAKILASENQNFDKHDKSS